MRVERVNTRHNVTLPCNYLRSFQLQPHGSGGFVDHEYAEAKFTIGSVPYAMTFIPEDGLSGRWVVRLVNDQKRSKWFPSKDDVDSQDAFGVTGSGNASLVMATAKSIIEAFKRRKPDAVLVFTAAEPSRQKLYDRMVKRYAPNTNTTQGERGAKHYEVK